MAYVSVPNDLSKIKTKLAFNLTKRQIVCFGAGAALGVPLYLVARKVIGNSAAMLLMLTVMLPAFLFAMYEKNGQPLEKVVGFFLRARFLRPGHRPYMTENIYSPFAGKEVALAKGKKGPKPRGEKRRRA